MEATINNIIGGKQLTITYREHSVEKSISLRLNAFSDGYIINITEEAVNDIVDIINTADKP